jgi:hypothetical protein
MFLVFQCVVTKEFENKFLTMPNQRSVLITLFTERLDRCCITDGECICGTSVSDLCKMTMPTVANIFLNNYCKVAADKHALSKDKAKRKLKTLTKS